MPSRTISRAVLHTFASADQNSSEEPDGITLVRYGFLPEGSSPLVSNLGKWALQKLSEEPDDAQFFSSAAASPNVDTLLGYISHHQQSINNFIDVFWFAVGFLLVSGTVGGICHLARQRRRKREVKTSTLAYMVCMVLLALSLATLMYSCVCLINTRDTLITSLVVKAPDMKGMAFRNLRAYVRDVLRNMNDSARSEAMSGATKLVSSEFKTSFRNFVEDKLLADRNAPLYNVARDCADDVKYLKGLMKENSTVPQDGSFRDIQYQCSVLNRKHQIIISRVVQHVSDSTAAERSDIVQGLRNSTIGGINETEHGVWTTLDGINAVEKSITDFEEKHAVYKYFSEDFMHWLLALILLQLLAVGVLACSLGIGATVRNTYVEPSKRSRASSIVGYAFIFSACLFIIHSITGMSMATALTAYSTLTECYLCAPYRLKHYSVLDDALAMLWPLERRWQPFTKLVPSELFNSCSNESTSILNLQVPKRNASYKYDSPLFRTIPGTSTSQLMSAVNGPDKLTLRDHTAIVKLLLMAVQKASSVSHTEASRQSIIKIYNKWARITDTGVTSTNESGILNILVPRISSYYSQFLKDAVTNAETLIQDTVQVIGPCYIPLSIVSSFMDVACSLFTTELVGHWVALLLAVTISVLVIPLAIGASSFFIKTKGRRRSVDKRGTKQAQEYVTGRKSSTMSSSGTFSARSGDDQPSYLQAVDKGPYSERRQSYLREVNDEQDSRMIADKQRQRRATDASEQPWYQSSLSDEQSSSQKTISNEPPSCRRTTTVRTPANHYQTNIAMSVLETMAPRAALCTLQPWQGCALHYEARHSCTRAPPNDDSQYECAPSSALSYATAIVSSPHSHDIIESYDEISCYYEPPPYHGDGSQQTFEVSCKYRNLQSSRSQTSQVTIHSAPLPQVILRSPPPPPPPIIVQSPPPPPPIIVRSPASPPHIIVQPPPPPQQVIMQSPPPPPQVIVQSPPPPPQVIVQSPPPPPQVVMQSPPPPPQVIVQSPPPPPQVVMQSPPPPPQVIVQSPPPSPPPQFTAPSSPQFIVPAQRYMVPAPFMGHFSPMLSVNRPMAPYAPQLPPRSPPPASRLSCGSAESRRTASSRATLNFFGASRGPGGYTLGSPPAPQARVYGRAMKYGFHAATQTQYAHADPLEQQKRTTSSHRVTSVIRLQQP